MDVSDAAAPLVIAQIDVVPERFGIQSSAELAVRTGVLYASGRYESLAAIHLFDVSDPSAPQHLSQTGFDPFFRFALDGNTLYADNGIDFQLFDVSDPAAPRPLGVLASPANILLFNRSVTDFVVGDGFAHFVIATTSTLAGIYSVDVGVPDFPERTYTVMPDPVSFGTPAGPSRAASEGDRLFMAQPHRPNTQVPGRLLAYDIAAPVAPEAIGQVALPQFPLDVAVAGAVVYVASDPTLQLVDAGDPGAPVLLGALATHATAVARRGDRLYVGTREGGVEIYDIADPASPTLIGAVALGLPAPPPPLFGPDPTEIRDLALTGDVLYGASRHGVRAVDVSDPASPVLLGSPLAANIAAIAASGARLYVQVSSLLQVYDVTDPAQPAEISRVFVSGSNIELDGDRLYLSGAVASVLDVAEPTAARTLASVVTWADELSLVKGVLYGVRGAGFLTALDFGPEYAPGAAIDVVPNSPNNRLNLLTTRLVTVAVLGSESLDVADVDPASLAFGPQQAPALLTTTSDANGDAQPDLLALFRVPETGIAFGDTQACLSGQRSDGRRFAGCDAIQAVTGCGTGYQTALLVPVMLPLRRWLRRRTTARSSS